MPVVAVEAQQERVVVAMVEEGLVVIPLEQQDRPTPAVVAAVDLVRPVAPQPVLLAAQVL